MKKKKILYVIPYFVPAWGYGGPVKVSFDFAKELVSSGYDITVVTTDVLDAKKRNNKLYEKIEGINIIRFKNISNILAKKFNFYSPIGLNRWLKQNIEKFDFIHIHEIFTYQSLVASRLCCKLHKPYIVQPHGALSSMAKKSRFYYLKNLFLKNLKSMFTNSQAIIVLNEKEKEDVSKTLPWTKSLIKIVPNGINLNEFKNIKKINLHRRYNISLKNKIIVFIGRIHKIKGLDISIKALSKIKDKCRFVFLIIGPDEGEKSNLEKLAEDLKIRDRIIFTGPMSGKRKLQNLKTADVSLLNSRSEGLPTTLLESAALGLPIICSPESNLSEVEKFKAGYIVGSLQETAEKIIIVLNNDSLLKKLSKNSLKLAQNFNIRKSALTLINIYRSK